MSQAVFDERVERHRRRLASLDEMVAVVHGFDEQVAARLGPMVADATNRCQLALDGSTGSWDDLDERVRTVTEIIGETLQVVGAAVVRAVGTDATCALADVLLHEVVAEANKPVWNSLTIPSHSDLFDPGDDSIRVGWGTDSIWGLPLVLHELGHAAGSRLSRIDEVNGRSAVTHPFVERANAIAEGLDSKFLHLQEYWADVYAVYVGGPAPLAAMTSLVFAPNRADRQTGSHPAPVRRVAAMTYALGELFPGDDQMALALRWIEREWSQLLDDTDGEIEPAPDVSPVVRQCLDDMLTCAPGARYAGLPRAYVLSHHLRTSHELPAGPAKMCDVVNAAWLARLSPDRTISLAELERRGRAVAEAVAGG